MIYCYKHFNESYNWDDTYTYCKSLPNSHLLYFYSQAILDDFKIISKYEIQMGTWVIFFAILILFKYFKTFPS